MRISDWSSDVCSSDLIATIFRPTTLTGADAATTGARFERVDLQGQGIRLQPLPGGVVPVSTPEPSAPDTRGQIKKRQRVRDLADVRSEVRRVGKEGVRTGRSRWLPHPSKQNHIYYPTSYN